MSANNDKILIYLNFFYNEEQYVHPQLVRGQQEGPPGEGSHRLSLLRYPSSYPAKNISDQSQVAIKIIDLKTIDN